MENALEKYRKKWGLTFEQMAQGAGFKSRSTVLQHCSGVRKVSAEAALAYSRAFGIDLSELRPDLWPPTAPPAMSPESAVQVHAQ
ncbi:helix-turn-helix transcriptional regulator [Desulfovibrio sp. 1188_IL3213]|uniref:helix-turn-helix transcriptional regulator n=1 Tax=unclassified Desulfovibrio TaxID=2593640 RepID=UPI003FA59702